jgi:ABC-type multidrug transport system ATPase subunit
MEEVQTISDDIAIIDGGRILCQGSLQALLQHNHQQAHITLAHGVDESSKLQLYAHDQLHWLSDHSFTIMLAESDLAPFLQSLTALGWQLEQVQYGARHLEDVFLQLTQRQLRD